jgi:aryl-alcohol dehydrogenase-like predicted oxidoreductase
VTPLEEVVASMNELVDEGKVRYLGCSNFAAWEIADAHWIARSTGRRPFVSAQNEYSLYNRAAEEELIPACQRFGLGLLPYFPLAYGLLTGKYRRGAGMRHASYALR